MAIEPGPQDRNTGSTPSSSVEDQLSAFRVQLDQEADNVDKVIPGFLFRDGEEKRARSLASSFYRINHCIAAFVNSIDDEQLDGHIQTYRMGLKTRAQLLDSIRPVEILEMVRDIWGKGELSQRERGVTLTYHYKKVEEEWNSTPGHHSMSGGTFLNPGSFSLGSRWRTGKWQVYGLGVEEEIGVDFGGYSPEDLSLFHKDVFIQDLFNYEIRTPKMNKFFADEYYEHGAPEKFRKLPNLILWRPENLGIYVTIPYTLHEERNKGVLQGYFERSTRVAPLARFNQSVSQQEIIDYLSGELETQRVAGQLPSQVEALELAKIEELRRRGLLTDERTHEAQLWVPAYCHK